MIPKVIHYCWFGGNPLTEKEERCINSWKKYCPDYEIRRWDENNFDYRATAYSESAYENRKWAFVSDYARFMILYENGGLYFDTDVELIRPIDDIVANGPFFGIENADYDGIKYAINPGLCMGAEESMHTYREVLDYYENHPYLTIDGTEDVVTVVKIVTDIYTKHGFVQEDRIQKVADTFIYPTDFFSPKDFRTGIIDITPNTRSIHHYAASWVEPANSRVLRFRYRAVKLLGTKIGLEVGDKFGTLTRAVIRIKKCGLLSTLEYYKGLIAKKRHGEK